MKTICTKFSCPVTKCVQNQVLILLLLKIHLHHALHLILMQCINQMFQFPCHIFTIPIRGFRRKIGSLRISPVIDFQFFFLCHRTLFRQTSLWYIPRKFLFLRDLDLLKLIDRHQLHRRHAQRFQIGNPLLNCRKCPTHFSLFPGIHGKSPDMKLVHDHFVFRDLRAARTLPFIFFFFKTATD